jgi:hypothetical protein
VRQLVAELDQRREPPAGHIARHDAGSDSDEHDVDLAAPDRPDDHPNLD